MTCRSTNHLLVKWLSSSPHNNKITTQLWWSLSNFHITRVSQPKTHITGINFPPSTFKCYRLIFSIDHPLVHERPSILIRQKRPTLSAAYLLEFNLIDLFTHRLTTKILLQSVQSPTFCTQHQVTPEASNCCVLSTEALAEISDRCESDRNVQIHWRHLKKKTLGTQRV